MQTVHSGGLQMGRCTVVIFKVHFCYQGFWPEIMQSGWYTALLGRNDRAHGDQDECASQAACCDYTGCMPPRVSQHAASN